MRLSFDGDRAAQLAHDLDSLVRNRTTGPLTSLIREVRDFLMSGEVIEQEEMDDG